MVKAKAKAKSMGVTFNDLIMGIVSCGLKEHFVAQGDTQDQITMQCPFTFQSIPKDPKDYKFGNDFVALAFYLKLADNLQSACEAAKKVTTAAKKSLMPGGGYLLL